ncbi:hypothetical protein EIB18_00500 [Caulobacter vibrioides]|uniref:hypothetical protein n=1 Tax=Caulobacter vibrioides TaxID=155892 RepID=UPI000BB4A1A5|nr:hypothetical protein [Caulobacter vibrioides]ATC23116.1 hypothetical protein CA608_00490 [Caulobacter vibrioides]AZH11329.1 hypothetical protein EIB18_00500 [Caulobacter vibrioides]PLR13211.1 hypothetical protein CVUC_07770 [Caulobacter vibrioides]
MSRPLPPPSAAPTPLPLGGGFRTRHRCFTRPAAEVMERDAERRTSVRKNLINTVSTKPDAPRSRYPPASREGGPVRALPGPGRIRFRKRPAIEEGRTLSPDHADGGRVSPASSAPDRSSTPLEPIPARPPPAATMVAGHAPFPRDEVGPLCG